jgi:hypothetical protein
MGEGEESLEEILDLFPEGNDDQRSGPATRRLISGVEERADACYAAEHEAQQQFPMPAGINDLDQMLDVPDQDGELLSMLGSNNSRGWSAEQESPEASARAPPPAFDDFALPHEGCRARETSADASPHPSAVRSERSGEAIPVGGQASSLVRHLGEGEDAADGSRKSARKRSITSRFDPAKDGAHPRNGRHKRIKQEQAPKTLARSELAEPVPKSQQKAIQLPSTEAKASAKAGFKAVSAERRAGRSGVSQKAVSAAGSRRSRVASLPDPLSPSRGKHVAKKPEMQMTARAGQRRWKELLVRMRAELQAAPTSAAFAKQLHEVKKKQD